MKKSIITSALLITIFSASLNAMDEENVQKRIEFLKAQAPENYELVKPCAWENNPNILVGIYKALENSQEMKDYWTKLHSFEIDFSKGTSCKRPVFPVKVKFGTLDCFDYAKVIECEGISRGGSTYITLENGTEIFFPNSFDRTKHAKMGNKSLIELE